MNSFKVVLDAATLIPPVLRDFILISAEANLYKPYWSDDILHEVRRNSIQKLDMSETTIDRVLANMRAAKAFEDSTLESSQYHPLISSMTNDPKDRHVLAAAVFCDAKLIVTPNVADFPKSALAPYAIEVKTPDQFFLDLFDFDPETMLRIITFYSLNRRGQKNIREIFDKLMRTVPRFVEEVERYILEVDQLYLEK
jgi:predicted nucleic acid-binding protein